MLENIKAVIFDMDGVLIDSETICDRIWYRLADEMGLPDIDKAIVENRGCNEKMMAEKLTRRYGRNFDCPAFFKTFSDYFHEVEFSEGIPLMPQVKETLDYLRDKEYRLGLSSSTRSATVKRQLTACGIFDYFECGTFGDEVTHSKPDPEIYLKTAEKLGVKPENCVGVEDSPNGVKSVHGAGLVTVMIPDKIEPDEEIKKLCYKIAKPISILREIL